MSSVVEEYKSEPQKNEVDNQRLKDKERLEELKLSLDQAERNYTVGKNTEAQKVLQSIRKIGTKELNYQETIEAIDVVFEVGTHALLLYEYISLTQQFSEGSSKELEQLDRLVQYTAAKYRIEDYKSKINSFESFKIKVDQDLELLNKNLDELVQIRTYIQWQILLEKAKSDKSDEILKILEGSLSKVESWIDDDEYVIMQLEVLGDESDGRLEMLVELKSDLEKDAAELRKTQDDNAQSDHEGEVGDDDTDNTDDTDDTDGNDKAAPQAEGEKGEEDENKSRNTDIRSYDQTFDVKDQDDGNKDRGNKYSDEDEKTKSNTKQQHEKADSIEEYKPINRNDGGQQSQDGEEKVTVNDSQNGAQLKSEEEGSNQSNIPLDQQDKKVTSDGRNSTEGSRNNDDDSNADSENQENQESEEEGNDAEEWNDAQGTEENDERNDKDEKSKEDGEQDSDDGSATSDQQGMGEGLTQTTTEELSVTGNNNIPSEDLQ